MIRTTVTIQTREVDFVLAETGEKIGRLRKQLGIDVHNVANVIRFGTEDAEDAADFADQFPETYTALVEAGINFDNIVAVMELK